MSEDPERPAGGGLARRGLFRGAAALGAGAAVPAGAQQQPAAPVAPAVVATTAPGRAPGVVFIFSSSASRCFSAMYFSIGSSSAARSSDSSLLSAAK